MCDFLPLCFVWGCPTKITPDQAGGPGMICPRCHNPSVQTAKSRMWFEFCFVPLIPCSSDAIYHCPICSWEAPIAGNPQPALAQPGYTGPQQQQYVQPGYQPPPDPQQAWGPPPGQQGKGYQQGGYGQPYPGGGAYTQQQGQGYGR